MEPSVFSPELKFLVPGEEQIYTTPLPGLYYLKFPLFWDDRGYFSSPAYLPELETVLGRPFVVRQLNHSYSESGVLRGLHLNGWDKLITITSGVADCVLVDLRPDSPTFKQWIRLIIGSRVSRASLFVPRGIANSFYALSNLDYVYLVNKAWKDRGANDDLAIDAFDPELKIRWGMDAEDVIMSPKDRNAPTLAELLASGKLEGYKFS